MQKIYVAKFSVRGEKGPVSYSQISLGQNDIKSCSNVAKTAGKSFPTIRTKEKFGTLVKKFSHRQVL
jgi:hypothetical protein